MTASYLKSKPKSLYYKFLGFLIKKGSKNSAKKTLDSAFLTVSKKTGLSLQSLILQVFFKLNSFVEVRKVRVKRSSHVVPFSIGLKRRSYLIIKWLALAASEDKRKVSLSEKLADEVLTLVKGSASKSLKLKEITLAQALVNRSNAHFRW
jgi:ribosomal protein S7